MTSVTEATRKPVTGTRPEKVKAAVMVAPGRMEVQELPYPDHLEPGAVIVKMEMSGICGTDKHAFRGEVTLYGGTESEQEMVFPCVHGHENAGVVVEIERRGSRYRVQRAGPAGGRPRDQLPQRHLRPLLVLPHRPRLPLLR